MTISTEAGNYLDELTLHEELLDYLDMLNPPGRHFQVQFWNLKDVYEKKARKTFRGPSYKFEDSVVMIEATSSRDLRSLRVYVQRCPEAAMKTHDTLGECVVITRHLNTCVVGKKAPWGTFK